MTILLALTLSSLLWQTTAPPAAPAPTGDFSKKVVRNGGVSDPEIAFEPSMTPQRALQETDETKQLIAGTEANLKRIMARGPDAERQDVIGEVKNYISLARSSLDSGDVESAHKLATKASVLTDDMVRH
jgi:hypothetical protein